MSTGTLHGAREIQVQVARLADEIRKGGDEPVLIGIRTNGVPLAKRLAAEIESAGDKRPAIGSIDITLYRDDLKGRALPQVHGSDIGDIESRRVVLVDDVLFTGRTVRAAMTELADYGRPERIELCVLVDRGHRELPICADYTGMTLETRPTDHVTVSLNEEGAETDAIKLEP